MESSLYHYYNPGAYLGYYVSILVLMESSLYPSLKKGKISGVLVSILVLMESSLYPDMAGEPSAFFTGFNPCFNGIFSLSAYNGG